MFKPCCSSCAFPSQTRRIEEVDGATKHITSAPHSKFIVMNTQVRRPIRRRQAISPPATDTSVNDGLYRRCPERARRTHIHIIDLSCRVQLRTRYSAGVQSITDGVARIRRSMDAAISETRYTVPLLYNMSTHNRAYRAITISVMTIILQ